VITVPAYFNDSQRKATILSAQMAGFKAVRLLNEPTAAAMAYGLFVSGEKHVVVVDFGGGTLDVSLLAIHDGKFQVLGIGGDTNLGGEDINDLVMAHVLENLQRQRSVPRSALSRSDLIQIKREVERAKVALSTDESVELELPNLGPLAKQKPFTLVLTRTKFESLCGSIWTRCLDIVEDVLREAGVETHEIDEVIMVGGSTRIPIVRSKVSAFFHDKELCMSVNADEVVCEGAAIQAAILSGIDKRVFRDVLMMDVIPLPIGLEKADGRMEVLLAKNSRIPVSVTKYFETFEDGQRGLTVQVYEGEKEMAKENDHISDFSFPLPRDKIGKAGEFRHPVTLTMNASGVLQVQAGIHHDSEDAPMSTTSLVIMVCYIVALFGLWLYLRIMFADERIDTPQ
jgi:heat shock 70kDa protein 1/2/6/8